jgi:glucan phosphorylase
MVLNFMTKKEHRIPIRVSSVLRILEGKQDNTLEQVVVPARGPVKLTDAKEAEKPLPAAVVKSQVKDAEQKQHQQEVREVAISFSSPVQTRSPQLPQVVPSANTAHEPEELEKEIAVLQQKLQAKEQKQLPTEFEIPVPSKPVIVEDINVLNLRVAYFCMEIGITNDLQFYAGGLGILAGDMLKSCADLDVPVVGISLFYRKGYMTQWLDESGWQFENMETIVPDARFVLLRERVTIEIEGRKVTVAAWLHKLKGIGGSIVPILFLDTDLPENAEQDRSITHDLYQGDHRYRIKQEAVLGIAGVRMLEKISATRIEKFHMNEGHSAFLTVELYRKVKDEESAVERVRDHAVFTTHTPVAAGHDKFDASLVHEVLGDEYIPNDLIVHATEGEGLFNMTKLGMYLSGHTNGVAKRHSEVTREMFPGYRIESITNGVYAREWISESIKQLYKKYLPDWEHDPYCLRYALSIPQEELWQAHIEAKRTLFTYVKQTTGIDMQEEVFTIGFARRLFDKIK